MKMLIVSRPQGGEQWHEYDYVYDLPQIFVELMDSMKKLLIIGATSAIAYETAKLFAMEGCQLMLTGRNEVKLDTIKNDLLVRGAQKVETIVFDVNEIERHDWVLQTCLTAFGGMDSVLIAHGVLPDQKRAEADVGYTLQTFQTNALSTIALLTVFAKYFEEQRQGCIAVISSVAGDRGRGSNYVYGAAKAAVSTFADGLRNRLFRSNVRVLTLKPGFVDTPMTENVPKNPLFTSADYIGKSIYHSMKSSKNMNLYLPRFWQLVMFLIKMMPSSIFNRLHL